MDCFKLMMEHEVTIKKPTSGDDGGGGVSVTYTNRTTGVACLINAPMRTKQDRFAQEQLIGTVTVATFDGTAQRGDKLVVTKGPPYVGAELHVTGIKSQPGVDALGFPSDEPIYHIEAEHVS